MSTSVLRRYTPPTCTLEVAATGSVLSRWTDRTVLKNLRFQLSFDDPKLLPDQQVTIKGDRLQLETLCEAVETYVQSVLNQAPNQLNTLLVRPVPNQEKLPAASPTGSVSAFSQEHPPSAEIYLKPRGLLAHDLYLGSLANGEIGSIVQLSALQLFDLANALDEYHAEALTLPSLGRPNWLKVPADWAKVAAVLVLAIGATGAVTKFVLDIASPVAQVASSEQDAEISAALSPAATPLPLPPSGTSSSELQLQPLFPPKPPTGALQPVPVPSKEVDLPPTGVTEAPPAAVAANPSSASTTESPADVPSSSQVVVLPTPDLSESGQATSPLADAPPPSLTASSSAAISPLVAEGNRLASTSIPVEPTSRSQAIGAEAPQVATSSSTAFDSFPQIAEIRDYFVRQWQPPSELTQTLEYRLVLNPDGMIQRVVPLGDASERFVDRTNMPLMGEPFVSPLQGRDQLQVRLVLSPDGKVQAFADGN